MKPIITQMLHDDEATIEPNVDLRRDITLRFHRSPFTFTRLWRMTTLVGATAVIAVALVSLNGPQSKGATSFIAQANAAYESLRTKLSEPGAVRHTITSFISYPDPSTDSVTFSTNDGQPDETWSNGDGTLTLSGPVGSPQHLHDHDKNYMDAERYKEYFPEDTGPGSGGTITSNDDGSWASSTTNGENSGPQYSITTPPDTASWEEKYDPADSSVACVDITPLTDAQKAARDSMDAINTASDAVAAGTAGPEALLSILSSSSAVTDRGIQHDDALGDLHVYRIVYDSALSAIDSSEIGKQGFREFGFSPDTYLMRFIRSGQIDTDGTEFVESTLSILTDEVLSADRIATDFFSPTRLGFVLTPPSDFDHPENLPSIILHDGCYRQGITAPEWLNAADEAAARARIATLGDQAPGLGGGGF